MADYLIPPADALKKKFPFNPTPGQLRLFELLGNFILDKKESSSSLIIKGYAGTGKTTVVATLVKILKYYQYKSMLLAPTGRAAKVMSHYAERKAFTIHKIIYKLVQDPETSVAYFKRQKNYHKNTIFIVDEASMLSNHADFGNQGLLADLINFVFENSTNKLILIGDTAQLPPVGQVDSPGLNATILNSDHKLKTSEIELTEVMRQEMDSGILFNATGIRNQIRANQIAIKFFTNTFPDIFRLPNEKMEDGLRYAYDKFGTENTVIICRSNKSAVQYNEYIRRTIHFYENELEVGDFLMIVKNNYFFLPSDSPVGFLANGDFVEIMKVVSFEEMHGFRFATLELRLVDYPNEDHLQAKVLLDTLHSYHTSLSEEDNRKLYQSVMEDYLDEPSKKKRIEAMRNDPYLNALQIKFAYALTCHKSQGGQWPAVFLDQGYLKEDMINKEYLRWLYTAITRATSELYLINFDKKFF
ncbi:AAA family ATPase [Fulvivirgaceae bacterium BMA10]|uniref:AAA family ATPase n=1 Tax=Splendidivirga corallicola TaxID=3051826 RepID=A0ABT8KIM5_9BACT|nr:AAA family ATPase [Fulvivirgaceae bacterium BMA10]